jgi:hypothetical protein
MYTLHSRCKCIISKIMASLHITDPHAIDKAVYWKAVEQGWDRDPKYRCICALFFAAAMELEMVERIKNESLKQTTQTTDSGQSDLHKQLLDLLEKMKHQHAETHEKVAQIHNHLVTQTNETGKVVHIIHLPAQPQSVNMDDLLKKVLELSRAGNPTAPPINPEWI